MRAACFFIVLFFASLSFAQMAFSATPLQQKQANLKSDIQSLKQKKADGQKTLQRLNREKTKIEKAKKNSAQKRRKLKQRIAKQKKQLQRQNRILQTQTEEYLSLVQNISSTVKSSDNQMLTLALAKNSQDTVLVYQTGSGLLDLSNHKVRQLRQTSLQTQKVKAKWQQALQEEKTFAYTLKYGQRDNRQKRTLVQKETSEVNQQLQKADQKLLLINTAVKKERKRLLKQRKIALATNDPKLIPKLAEQDPFLTKGQWVFSYQLASLTGLDVNVVKAWVLAEMSGNYALEREIKGNHNWLNIGYFDRLKGDGAFQRIGVWSNPTLAATASAAFLEGKFLGASKGIQNILKSSEKSPAQQLKAIATSGWASSGYHNGKSLRGTYNLVNKTQQPKAKQVLFKDPKGRKLYSVGKK